MTINNLNQSVPGDETYTPINKGQFTLETPERELDFEKKRGFGVEEAYKENRRQWTEYPRKQFVSDYPLHVDIELASICNLNCPMCYTITPEFKQKVHVRLMDFDLFKKLVDECSAGGVYSIRLSLRGESFLHKRIIECVSYAKQKGIKEVSTLTNGLKLDEQMFKEIMDAGMDWITISFDGLGETYEQIRRPAQYDRAVEKIRNYQQIKKESGRVKPLIKVQSILPAIEKAPQAFYDVFAPITDMVSANPLIDFMQNTAQLPKIPNFTCPQIFQRLTIGADGLCMMCANDETNEHVVGDVNKQTIHEIWHGPEMARVREIHSQHKGCELIGPCKHCYLPLETYDAKVELGTRYVVAEKYVSGTQKVSDLNTPEKFKRSEMDV
jgi:radical SAM protein with 4Fe4S-binding SPASM domain